MANRDRQKVDLEKILRKKYVKLCAIPADKSLNYAGFLVLAGCRADRKSPGCKPVPVRVRPPAPLPVYFCNRIKPDCAER
jgi:hypothetical protein